MSLFDWNKDGKKDFYDTYVEYRIHKKMQEKYKKQKEEYDFREEYDRRYKPKNKNKKIDWNLFKAWLIIDAVLLGILALVIREGAMTCILFIIVVAFVGAAISEFFN